MYYIFKYTLIEYVRNRIYLSAIGLIIILAGISYLGSSYNQNFHDYYIGTLSFGMNLTELLVIALTLFLPVNHLSMEFERGTSPILWSKIKSKSAYYTGKFFAFGLLSIILVFVGSLFIGLVALLQGTPFVLAIRLGYFTYGLSLEVFVVLGITFLLYSVLHSAILSSLLSLLVLYFGIFLDVAREMMIETSSAAVKFFYGSIYYILPKISYFNLEVPIIYQEPIGFSKLFTLLVYAFIFTGATLSIANLILGKKEV